VQEVLESEESYTDVPGPVWQGARYSLTDDGEDDDGEDDDDDDDDDDEYLDDDSEGDNPF
jgi:hypothetical protein